LQRKRIFLDANILFTAAHNPDGKAALLVELAQKGHWDLFTSAYAIEEAVRNLEIKYPECKARLIAALEHLNPIRHNPEHPYPGGLAPKDRPIFQAAMACSATHLLTGDIKDFGRYMNQPDATFNICIQTVADFYKDFLEKK
jgi:predicted nucleic acid-binding protein